MSSLPPVVSPPVRWYLSGPMSGLPLHNVPAFDRAARLLRAEGLTIVSPHEQDGEGDPATPWHHYLRRDLRLLVDCDGIILLPGWPASKGARLELHVALELGMAVRYFAADARGLVAMERGA